MIRTSKIVQLEEEYAAANRGIKFLVGARDIAKSPEVEESSPLSSTASTAANGGKKKKRAGTVILPFTSPRSQQQQQPTQTTPPSSSVSLPASPLLPTTDPTSPQERKEALHNLLKSM
jgi:hypothetical protein